MPVARVFVPAATVAERRGHRPSAFEFGLRISMPNRFIGSRAPRIPSTSRDGSHRTNDGSMTGGVPVVPAARYDRSPVARRFRGQTEHRVAARSPGTGATSRSAFFVLYTECLGGLLQSIPCNAMICCRNRYWRTAAVARRRR